MLTSALALFLCSAFYARRGNANQFVPAPSDISEVEMAPAEPRRMSNLALIGAKAATLSAKAFQVATAEDRPIISAVADGALSSVFVKQAMGKLAEFTLNRIENSHRSMSDDMREHLQQTLDPTNWLSPSSSAPHFSVRQVEFHQLNEGI